MRGVFPAPGAVFFQIQFPFNEFFVLSRPVVDSLARRTLHFYKIWLRHVISLKVLIVLSRKFLLV